jgi:glycosyltransferase involved in cell wall biosynthesis
MDVFASTSIPRSEGAPTAIIEAMMMALPVVATDVASVSEVVEDGVTGWVVPPLEPEAISDAILKLLDAGGLRVTMGKAARQRAVDLFSMETCAATHLRAYALAAEHRYGRVALARL